MFNGELFKQAKGLAMGNRLAQILAEIRTNYALNGSLESFSAEMISFLYKYVDDVFTAANKSDVIIIKNEVSRITNMELTITYENSDNEIEFLDCIFRRNNDLTISSRWNKKNYSSKSVLNFHSHHPVSTKRNVIMEMINHAFDVSSPEFYEHTRDLLVDILRRSSYPEAIINSYLNPFSLRNEPCKLIGPSVDYVSCPFSNPSIDRIKCVVRNNRLNLRIAPRPMFNNRRMIFSRIKDVQGSTMKRNAIFKFQCNDCTFTRLCTTGNWDVQRAFQRIKNENGSPWYQHKQYFPNHTINERIQIVKTFYNKFDADQSNYIVNQIGKIVNRK